MKDPAFLFYSSDFLSGTMLMSDEDVGKYIRLLCLQHQKGHLNEKEILKICKEFNEDIFSKFKKDEEGKYFNERLEEEANKRKAYSESRRNNRNKVNNSNTCVYLIQDIKTNLIKIGSSNNPERRLVELKNQYENDNLILLAYAENVEQKLETKLHNDYKNQNRINEWFDLSDEEIQEIIKNNHMKLHMINHMYKHMENENEIENINININDNRNEKYEKIIEIYNMYCVNLPQVQKLTNKRKTAINKLLNEINTEQFEQICIIANKSDFLIGNNDRGWKADFDFILKPDKAISILEGKYDNINQRKKINNKSNFEQREYDNLDFFYANKEV
jgi:hypothetical protein